MNGEGLEKQKRWAERDRKIAENRRLLGNKFDNDALLEVHDLEQEKSKEYEKDARGAFNEDLLRDFMAGKLDGKEGMRHAAEVLTLIKKYQDTGRFAYGPFSKEEAKAAQKMLAANENLNGVDFEMKEYKGKQYVRVSWESLTHTEVDTPILFGDEKELKQEGKLRINGVVGKNAITGDIEHRGVIISEQLARAIGVWRER